MPDLVRITMHCVSNLITIFPNRYCLYRGQVVPCFAHYLSLMTACNLTQCPICVMPWCDAVRFETYEYFASPMMCPPKNGARDTTSSLNSTGLPSSIRNSTASPAWGACMYQNLVKTMCNCKIQNQHTYTGAISRAPQCMPLLSTSTTHAVHQTQVTSWHGAATNIVPKV